MTLTFKKRKLMTLTFTPLVVSCPWVTHSSLHASTFLYLNFISNFSQKTINLKSFQLEGLSMPP